MSPVGRAPGPVGFQNTRKAKARIRPRGRGARLVAPLQIKATICPPPLKTGLGLSQVFGASDERDK